MSRRYTFFILSYLLMLSLAPAAFTQVLVSADAVIIPVNEGDIAETGINIANEGENAVDFRVRIMPGQLDGQLGRDDRGGPDDMEMEWRDSNEDDGPMYDWIDIADLDDVLDLEANDDDSLYGPFDLGFVMPYYGNEYDELFINANGFATFLRTALFPFYNNFGRLPNANPGAENATPPRTFLACNFQDLDPSLGGGHIYFWTDDYMAVVTWEDIQHFGMQGQGSWTFQLIINADGLVKYQYQNVGPYDDRPDIIIGLQNEDRDLGFTTAYNTAEYIEEELAVAYGPPAAFVNWLHVDPMSGSIEGASDQDLFLTIGADNLDPGYYYARLLLSFSDDNPSMEIPVVLSYGAPVGAISGVVTDASNDEPIVGASVNLNEIDYTVTTGENGEFAFNDIPVGMWNVTIIADNFNQFDEQDIEVVDGEVTDVAIAMLHGTFDLSREGVIEQLAPDTDIDVSFTATNNGNAAVHFTAERRLVGDANAEPWAIRRGIEAGNALEDDRIQGAIFADEQFYLAGAAGDDTSKIYVLNRDGQETARFNQAGTARYGYKDLEFDGEWIWGSGEADLFGFDLEGNVQAQFRGPFNPTNNIAWDEVNGVLWCAGTTTNIQGMDREGNAVGNPLNRLSLRIYGLAYFPDDPDGYTLYILNTPGADIGTFVHKMNPANGDTMLVQQIAEGGAPLPESMFISNEYDIYSWVIMTIRNRPVGDGGDRLDIIQLDARKDWMAVAPEEGVIDAGDNQEFTLTLDATGLPEADFEGEIYFQHDGRGGSTSLPLTLSVVLGPVHAERNVQLMAGWNMISLNLQPDDGDIRRINQDLVDQELLVMMKDGAGHFYRPDRDFNSIPDWNVAEGYQYKVTEACVLTTEGVTVMADDPIPLVEGWQMISYYPRFPVEATVALSGVADHLEIAKDGFGNFYLPSRNFSNMGEMRAGQGYQIRVDQDIELVYQLGGQRAAQFTSNQGLTPTHFASLSPTGSDMSVLLTTSLQDGEIGAYSGGRIVGSGVINNGICGLAIRGDDPTTASVDGALPGEPINFKIWNGSSESEALIKPESGESIYQQDGLFIAGLTSVELPNELSLQGIYPNPFNSTTTISFRLPAATRVTLSLFDQTGRLVDVISDGVLTGGSHQVQVNAEHLPSGVYFARLSTPEQNLKAKLLLLR